MKEVLKFKTNLTAYFNVEFFYIIPIKEAEKLEPCQK